MNLQNIVNFRHIKINNSVLHKKTFEYPIHLILLGSARTVKSVKYINVYCIKSVSISYEIFRYSYQ